MSFGPDKAAQFVLLTGLKAICAFALCVFFHAFGSRAGIGCALTFAADIFITAVFDIAPLGASTFVFDAGFVGPGGFIFSGQTFFLTILAGSSGTIGHTFLILTLLSCHTDGHTFAFAPGIAGTTCLSTLAADFDPVRGAGSLRVGFAIFTTIDDADGFVR